jgi:hypothetical protein
LVKDVETYRKLAETDPCGALELAGQAVGTAFVGIIASTISLAELIRPLHGGPSHGIIFVDLEDPDAVDAVVRDAEPIDLVSAVRARPTT